MKRLLALLLLSPLLCFGQSVTIGGNVQVGGSAGGGVSSVTATSPIVSSGGATPIISCPTCATTAGATTVFSTFANPVGTIASSKLEKVSVAASGTQNLVNYSGGDGYVSHLLVAIEGTDPDSRENSTINIYYNGSGTPTISVPIYLFTGSKYMATVAGAFTSRFINVNSGNTGVNDVGYDFALPIPFTGGIKIDLVNGSATTAMFVWTTVEYHTGVTNNWSYTRQLKVGTLSTGSVGCTANSAQTLLDDSAAGVPGLLMGVWLESDGFINTVVPRSAPMEGNIKIYLDGSGTPAYESSGTEDYFGFTFYAVAQQGENNVPGSWHGSTYWNNGGATNNTWSFYRFYVDSPPIFSTGLKVTWNCGDTAEASFTGNPVVWGTVWYYTQ